MSKNNRSAKKELERIYGKGCFFERAHIAERIEAMGGIRTFKIFIQEKKFKGKPISHQITYHHLKHRSEGGKATVENGANVEEVAHQYLHSLPRDQEEVINNMLREFKLNCVMMTGNGQIQEAKSISFDFGEDVLVIPLYVIDTAKSTVLVTVLEIEELGVFESITPPPVTLVISGVIT